MTDTHQIASMVAAEDGDVHVDGPDGICYSMSPDAAEETSDRLLAGAADAQGQRLERQQQDSLRGSSDGPGSA